MMINSFAELLFDTFKELASYKWGWLLDIAILVTLVSLIELGCKLIANIFMNLCRLIGGIFDWWYQFSIMHKVVKRYQTIVEASNVSSDEKIIAMKYLMSEIQDSLIDSEHIITSIPFRDLVEKEKNKEPKNNEPTDTGESTY